MSTKDAGKIKCRHCESSFSTLTDYVDHQQIHAFAKNFTFLCPYDGCGCYLQSKASFANHRKRAHSDVRREDFAIPSELLLTEALQCTVLSCEKYFGTKQALLSHLRNHISQGTEVVCPFVKPDKDCTNKFLSVKTFNVHINQYHKTSAVQVSASAAVDPPMEEDPLLEVEGLPSVSFEVEEVGLTHELEAESPTINVEAEDELYSTSAVKDFVARFYLWLEGQLLLSSTNVQKISEQLSRLSFVSHGCLKKKLSEELSLLTHLNLTTAQREGIVNSVFSSDVVFNVHHKGHDPTQLTSTYLRKEWIKKNFKYVEPEEIHLGERAGKNRYGHYIPIKKTVETLLLDPSVQREVNASFLRKQKDSNIFEDYRDGSVYKNHPVCSKGKSIDLILFQDAFDFTSLSASEGIYKTVGFYYTLGNFSPHNRSKLYAAQLAFLVTDSDYKHFQQKVCLSRLVLELEDLIKNGVQFGDETVPVVPIFMLGDNLGSHEIGGFVTSFRCGYFCRYCDIFTDELQDEPHKCNVLRTPQSYDKCVAQLPAECQLPDIEGLNASLPSEFEADEHDQDADQDQPSDLEEDQCSDDELEHDPADKVTSTNHVKGIKFASILNLITFFHVCNPALPPCLAHDLFEGLVAYDLALFIKYFIKKKWFTLEHLNQCIARFKCCGSDVNDAPVKRKLGEKFKKLPGHASEVWCFLRVFPLLIGNCILDPDDEVWSLYVRLKSICEYICAPRISLRQLSILKASINLYLAKRKDLFPDSKLKPKHHFLSHYPDLVTFFGPLIRVWTMRFESLHKIFKKIAVASNNFINFTYTLSNKFQYHFAYRNSGEMFPPEVMYDSKVCSELDMVSLKPEVRNLLDLTKTYRSLSSVTVRGTSYKRGLLMLLERSDTVSHFTVGEILLIILDNEEVKLVLKICTAINTFMGYFEIIDSPDTVVSVVPLNSIEAYYPLPSYEFNHKKCFVLKHTAVFMDEE